MSKNFKLLTTAIVTALDASNPTPVGAVWNPDAGIDMLEADALARVGFAEETNEKPTYKTVSQRNGGVKKAPPISGISVDAIKQADGTYKSAAGVRVNADGSEYVPTADEEAQAQFVAFLARPADQVIANAGSLSEAQAKVLTELETAGKARTTVLSALAAVKDA